MGAANSHCSKKDTVTRILCLASAETIAIVQQVADRIGLQVFTVKSISEALLALEDGPWAAVVAALGTQRGHDILLDQGPSSSSLIQATKRLQPTPRIAVFSWTACRRDATAVNCRKAGADAVICSADALFELLSPPSARILCLASVETTEIVKQVASKHHLDVVSVSTNADALIYAAEKGPWAGVVAALGTRPGVDLIFDTADDRSSLISLVKGLSPSVAMIIFSYTACEHPEMALACKDAGADAVLCSHNELDSVITSAMASRSAFLRDVTSCDDLGDDSVLDRRLESAPSVDFHHPIYSSLDEYPLLAVRIAKEMDLESNLGSGHQALLFSRSFTQHLSDMISGLPRPLTLQSTPLPSQKVARFVHISDTHHHHASIHLPPGDVLLHTGDWLGNYGGRDLLAHLKDFSQWICNQSRAYKLTVLIAGNHDSLMDQELYPTEAGQVKEAFLQSLPSNVVYLESSGIEYEGFKIWGSPYSVCRYETLGKRYLSNGFERARALRQQAWLNIPEGLDVLLTHCPPRGTLCHPSIGCDLLAARLKDLEHPPHFHCFGHDHDYFGVKAGATTVHINAAFEEVRRRERGSESCAWVFDVCRS